MTLTRCANAIVILQLALALLCISFVADAEEQPLQSSSPPLIIEGLVYCKPCRYKDKPTLKRASPLPGAKLKLQYSSLIDHQVHFATTNASGGFLFTAPVKIENPMDVKKYTRVFLVSAPPGASCPVPTYFLGGIKGAAPNLVQYGTKGYFCNVGPFAFDTPNKCNN